MSGRKIFAVGVGVFAVAAAGAAGRVPAKSPDARLGLAAESNVWIGSVDVVYTRNYESGNSTSLTEGEVHVKAREDATATAVARRHHHVEFSGTCPSIYDELGTFNGRTTRVYVTVFPGGRYKVEYPNPRFAVAISEQKECKPTETRSSTADALAEYVPIEGTTANRNFVTGTLELRENKCLPSATCPTTKKASWTLRRLGTSAGGGGGGGGTGGRPGSGCEKHAVNGTLGHDRLTGTARADVIRGFRGNDVLRGLAGNDCLWGHAGRDKLQAAAGNDLLTGGPGSDLLVGGIGIDRFSAGTGDDVVRAIDGRAEIILCGRGHDSVRADRIDKLNACENVTRR